MYNSHTDIWVAGAFAAVVVDFIVYPFDTLKTRIQSPNYEKIYKDPRTGAVKRNVLFRGLYQGVWSVVFSTIPSSGAFFTTYEAVKCTLHDSSTHSTSTNKRPEYYTQGSRSTITLPFTHSLPAPIIHGIASCTAEMVSCLMLTPAEVLKQNAQMVNTAQAGQAGQDSSTKKNNVTAMRQVLAKFKGHPWRLWSGYTALVGRNLPFTGLQFPLFEYVRSHVLEWWKRRKDGAGRQGGRYSEHTELLIERAGLTGLSAGVSGIVSSFVTTPIDVVKTRVMLSATEGSVGAGGGNARSGSAKKPTKGTFAVGREIFQREGIRGLFKGGAIRAGWTAVSLSLYLSIYEGGRVYLENRRKRIEGVDDRLSRRSNEGDAVI